jgi:hypothetical protein
MTHGNQSKHCLENLVRKADESFGLGQGAFDQDPLQKEIAVQ